MNNEKRILITGGHASPAVAVLDELILRGHTNIIWVGEKYNQRGSKVPSAEFTRISEDYHLPFVSIKAGKLIRKWSRQTLLSGISELFSLLLGFVQAFFIVLKYKPHVIVSFGGFLAVPVVFWSWVFRRSIVTHEQTIVTGLANKIISKFANKICISFPSSSVYFPTHKVIFTGNPIRQATFTIQSHFLDVFTRDLPVLYITGGNQGAHEMNWRVLEIIDSLLDHFNVIHQTGNSTVTNDHLRALETRETLTREKQNHYIVETYFYEDTIGEIFSRANVILSRAGANTTIEILAHGILSVFIPIPWTSHDEQTKNAQFVESLGLAKVVTQNDKLSPDDILRVLLDVRQQYVEHKALDGSDLDECRKNAKKQVKLDAAQSVADVVEDYL